VGDDDVHEDQVSIHGDDDARILMDPMGGGPVLVGEGDDVHRGRVEAAEDDVHPVRVGVDEEDVRLVLVEDPIREAQEEAVAVDGAHPVQVVAVAAVHGEVPNHLVQEEVVGDEEIRVPEEEAHCGDPSWGGPSYCCDPSFYDPYPPDGVPSEAKKRRKSQLVHYDNHEDNCTDELEPTILEQPPQT
jgi:hypothetical protein